MFSCSGSVEQAHEEEKYAHGEDARKENKELVVEADGIKRLHPLFYLKNATAQICSFTEAPKVIRF